MVECDRPQVVAICLLDIFGSSKRISLALDFFSAVDVGGAVLLGFFMITHLTR
jgi:hypothetical protein